MTSLVNNPIVSFSDLLQQRITVYSFCHVFYLLFEQLKNTKKFQHFKFSNKYSIHHRWASHVGRVRRVEQVVTNHPKYIHRHLLVEFIQFRPSSSHRILWVWPLECSLWFSDFKVGIVMPVVFTKALLQIFVVYLFVLLGQGRIVSFDSQHALNQIFQRLVSK